MENKTLKLRSKLKELNVDWIEKDVGCIRETTCKGYNFFQLSDTGNLVVVIEPEEAIDLLLRLNKDDAFYQNGFKDGVESTIEKLDNFFTSKDQICSTCYFSRIHDGKEFPGKEYKGQMYCIAWSDGYEAEWTKPDGYCHKWKPKKNV